MIGLLKNFEPRIEEKGEIIFKELEEIHEVLFQEKGTIDIGYEINRKARYVLRMNKGTVIGAYNCIENKKNAFTFKAATDVHGFMLRKYDWLELLDSAPEFNKSFRQNIKEQYVKNIHVKVMMEKRRYLNNLEQNNLNDHVISILDLKKKKKDDMESMFRNSKMSIDFKSNRGDLSRRSNTNQLTTEISKNAMYASNGL